MKKRYFLFLSIVLLYACTSSPTGNTNELSIKDDKLAGFLLGGIYFFHGYGGANAVFDMVKAGAKQELKTKEFVEELGRNYTEIMVFPFTAEQAISSKETLEQSWKIKDKSTFLSTLDFLKKSGHQDEFLIYKKMMDENGGANVDITKIGANTDEEVKRKLEFIKNNYAAISTTGIKAWDYARYVNNVCLGYSAEYITKEEGEKLVADLSKDARSMYSNWDEYYKDYIMGLKYWGSGQENDAEYSKVCKEMMEGDYSIYKYLSLKQ